MGNTKITAENNAKIASAEASAEANRIKAEAEAHAIELKAAAEAKRAEMLSKTPLGQQLSLALPYMEMMQKVGEGVEKVVYCDSTLQKSGNPFSLPTLQALNTDLQLLNEIGDSVKRESAELPQP